MYLFVFIFLLLATMGLFTQTYMIQAARLWANQKTAAELMFVWHRGAYELAKEKAASITPDCSISPYSPSGLTPCGVQLVAPVGSSYCAGCTRHYLPIGYKWEAQWQFPSVVYVVGSVRYLATYVPKEAGVGETAWLGYTAAEFLTQMRNAKFPYISFGQVIQGSCNGGAVGRWFSTGAFVNTTQICYPALNQTIPPAAVIPVGSVGLVSVL